MNHGIEAISKTPLRRFSRRTTLSTASSVSRMSVARVWSQILASEAVAHRKPSELFFRWLLTVRTLVVFVFVLNTAACLDCAGIEEYNFWCDNPSSDGGEADLRSAGPAFDASSETRGAWSFFFAGDSRECHDILERNVRAMSAINPSAVAFFMGGDLTATGSASDWELHMEAIEAAGFRADVTDWGPYTRYIGVMGNHDITDPDWYRNWNHYLSGQRDLGYNSEYGIFFTLRYRNALFIVLDSEHLVETGMAQLKWLENVLEDATEEWKFAFFHQPIYACNEKPPYASGLLSVALFERYGLDIAFVAHSHTYERTCPMLHGRCAGGDANGVVYLQNSGAGAPTRPVYSSLKSEVSFLYRTDYYDCSEILESYYTNIVSEENYCAYSSPTDTDENADADVDVDVDDSDGYEGIGFFTQITVDGCRLNLSTYNMHRELIDQASYSKCK